jgi:hypothetical protein
LTFKKNFLGNGVKIAYDHRMRLHRTPIAPRRGCLLAASVEVSSANVGVSNDPVKERAGWASLV